MCAYMCFFHSLIYTYLHTKPTAIVSFVIGILIVVFSYVYIRKRVLFLLKSFPEELDAHQMMLEGTIDAPGVLCCTPAMCPSCYL